MKKPENVTVFGRGKRNLVIIPGLSIKKVGGQSVLLSQLFRVFIKEYRVYLIDRRDTPHHNCTNWDLADEAKEDMDALGIEKADIIGVSQGGMIAQCLAIRYPEKVNKLVLGATSSRPNDTLKEVVKKWITLAQRGDYVELNVDSFKKLYTEDYLSKHKLMMSVVSKTIKPDNVEGFVNLATACLSFDIYDKIDMIKCPLFVLGGAKDAVVTAEASEEIASKLNGRLFIYKDYGHAVYDEAPDFYQRVMDFLME